MRTDLFKDICLTPLVPDVLHTFSNICEMCITIVHIRMCHRAIACTSNVAYVCDIGLRELNLVGGTVTLLKSMLNFPLTCVAVGAPRAQVILHTSGDSTVTHSICYNMISFILCHLFL